MNNNSTPKISAVIVTHNPSDNITLYCTILLPQIEHIIVVDNASTTDKKALLKELAQKHPTITLLENDENIGLSKAQNRGISHAFSEHAPDWVLLLDDDSEPAPSMIIDMLSAYHINPNKENIGLITPQIIDRHTDISYPCLIETSRLTFERRNIMVSPYNQELYIEELFCALASGSLIKREVFEKVGLMNEAFFIDFIDWDFAFRLQKNDYHIMCAPRATLYHSIGNRSQHRFLGKTLSPTNHSSKRRYTMAKNRVIFWWTHCKLRPAVFFYTLASLINDTLLIVLCEKNKLPKIWALIKGLVRGIFSSKTPNIPTLPSD